MTPAERHALEKQALHDPFLADALEGAESVSSNDFLLDVDELNQKIASAGKSRWLWPLRIAASVAGIALISTVIILSMSDNEGALSSNQQTETKPEEKTAQETDSVSKNKADKSGDGNLVAGLTKEKKESKTETKPALTFRRENQTASSGTGDLSNRFTITTADTVAAEGLAAATIKTDSMIVGYISELAEEEKTTDVALSQPAVVNANDDIHISKKERAKKIATTGLTITGQVRDQQGQPLPGATVNIKDKVAGVVTDADGKYSLTLQDSSATLQYAFIGFGIQEMKVDKSNDYVNVQLMEDATQLSEVVVTGYGEKKVDGEPVVRLAEPIGGRQAYDKYLEDEKMYPQQALENKIEGKVVIEFTIGATGTISDFTVVKKLGFGCDEEVIRLVKEGPGWYPSYIDNEPVESLVRIKTRFELPEKK